jgi:predicted RNase H-like nuclease (RuvC/YqgF family)
MTEKSMREMQNEIDDLKVKLMHREREVQELREQMGRR